MLSRSAPRRLVGNLRAAAVDEESVVAMSSLLGRLGSVAAPAADILTLWPDGIWTTRTTMLTGPWPRSYWLPPQQSAPLLAADLGQRPRAFDAAAGFRSPEDSAFPYHGELLDAVRDRLARPESLSGNERTLAVGEPAGGVGRRGSAGVARALWRVTGDAEGVVAVPDSVFARAEQNPWSRWSVVRAARTAVLLGPAGRPLAARLEAALNDPVQAAAVLALTAVAEPASPDRTTLAEAALRSGQSDADPAGACDALEALGPEALADGHARRLAALADGDARVVRSGVEDRVIRQDEALRNRARALLPACPDNATP